MMVNKDRDRRGRKQKRETYAGNQLCGQPVTQGRQGESGDTETFLLRYLPRYITLRSKDKYLGNKGGKEHDWIGELKTT